MKTMFLLIALIAGLTGLTQETNYYIGSDSIYVYGKTYAEKNSISDDNLRQMLNNPGVEMRCKLFVVDSLRYHRSNLWLTRDVYASSLTGIYLPKNPQKPSGLFFQNKTWTYGEKSWEIIIFSIFFAIISLITALHRYEFMGSRSLSIFWLLTSCLPVCTILPQAFIDGHLSIVIWTSLATGIPLVIFIIMNQIFRDTPQESIGREDIALLSRMMCMIFAGILPITIGILSQSWLAGLSFFGFCATIYPLLKYPSKLLAIWIEKKNNQSSEITLIGG